MVNHVKSKYGFLVAFMVLSAVVFLYAFQLRSAAIEYSQSTEEQHQEVVYKARVLESYSGFTYILLFESLLLASVFVVNSKLKKSWFKYSMGLVIAMVNLIGSMLVYKSFFNSI